MSDAYTPDQKRQRTSITLPRDMIAEAKEYDLNISRLAEERINEALKEKAAENWLKDNKEAIDFYNQKLEKDGPLIMADWLMEEEQESS